MSSLTHKTTTGILWNFAQQISSKSITVIVTLLLAYFLTPEDFGLVAMMAMFLGIATSLMDSGLNQALIRMDGATQADFNTAFYANIALGLLAYSLLYISAPYIAGFYDQNRLTSLVRVGGLTILINAFQVVQVAKLSRELNFKVLFKSAVPASFISAVIAVLMAYMGYGVWALIGQMLGSAICLTFFLWLQRIWRPTWGMSWVSLLGMYNFGYKLFLSGLLDTIFRNLYVLVIAKFFTATIAGLYFFADKIKELVIYQLVFSIQSVTFPALATLQKDNIRLKAGYRKIIAVTTFILFPAILFLAALAEPLFHLLLPDKWWPAISYLQLICLASVLVPMHAINLNILKVKGRSDLFLLLELIKKSMSVVILLIAFQYGVIGILIGQIVGSVLAYLPNSFFSQKLIAYPIKEQLFDFIPNLTLAACISIILYELQRVLTWPSLVELIILGSLGCFSFVMIAYLLNFAAYQHTKELISSRASSKSASPPV